MAQRIFRVAARSSRRLMRSVTRAELREIHKTGDGLVLVDHLGRGRDRPSTLHAASCRWADQVGGRTPIRFSHSPAEALRWLTLERGDEGEGWQKCPECKASGVEAV